MKLAEIVNEIQQLDEMTQQRLLAYLQSSIGNVIYGKEPITKEIKNVRMRRVLYALIVNLHK
jgi:hypothetical protein